MVAFGCTEEHLLATIFGVKQRGQPGQHAFVHSTGEGYVKAKQGHYHDALTVKQNTVVALIAEPFGGVTAFTHRVLTRLAKVAADGRDGTVYGAFSTDSYYQQSRWRHLHGNRQVGSRSNGVGHSCSRAPDAPHGVNSLCML